jgi:hypothetical protein
MSPERCRAYASPDRLRQSLRFARHQAHLAQSGTMVAVSWIRSRKSIMRAASTSWKSTARLMTLPRSQKLVKRSGYGGPISQLRGHVRAGASNLAQPLAADAPHRSVECEARTELNPVQANQPEDPSSHQDVDGPARRLTITYDTTDEEHSAFIRGKPYP